MAASVVSRDSALLSLEAFKLTGLIMSELPIFPAVFRNLSVSTCLSISLL